MASRVISSLSDGESMFKQNGYHNGNGQSEVCRPKLRRGISLRDSYKRRLLALPPQKRENARQRSLLKRTRLCKVSPKKRHWKAIYLSALRFLIALDPICRRCRCREANQGHYPFGQMGALILLFWPFCMTCHNEVEFHKNQSRDEGWILYPIRLA